MRRFLLAVAALFLIVLPGFLHAQTLISWDPVSTGSAGPNPWTPGFLNASLTSPSNGIVRGSSLTSNGTSGTYGGPASGGYLGYAGTITGTSADDVKSHKFSIRAACGTISLSSIQGATRRSSSGPTTVNVYYALNGSTTHTFIGTWNTSSTSGTTGTAGSSSLSGIAALQNIPAGTTVEFIFTPNGGTSTGGTWYFTSSNLSLSGTVVAVAAPTVGVSPANATIPAASGTTFSVSSVTGAASYQWQRNTSGIVGGTWVNITSATMDPTGTYSGFSATSTASSNTLTLSNVPASWDGYGYRCVVTNCAGSSNSNPALLNVSSGACSGTPAGGAASPIASTAFCGSGSTTINLTGGASGTGLTYQWSSSNTNTAPGTDIPGATSAAYTTPALTETTYYWVTTTCSGSASSISSVGIVSVNPTPVVTVTPPGGDYCSGSSGVNMTASGAATYSWAPGTGLSATAGASVTATPSAATTYTVTGTSAAGCAAQSVVTVNSYTTPGPITIAPAALSACLGGTVTPVTASLGAAGPAVASSGTISASFSSGSPAATPLSISSIPVGAAITGISVVFSVAQVSGGWNADDIIALKAPNGNILNLFNAKGGSSSTGGINGMEINSTSATAIPATGATYTGGVYSADAALGVGAPGNLSNVANWSDLYSAPNGNWQLLGHYTFASGSSVFTSWTITITYTLPSFTWAPNTNLFTDPAGTIAYSGTLLNTVYQNPLAAGVTTYTVTAANGSCATSTTTTMTVTALPTAITAVSSLCSGLTTTLSNGTPGGVWSSGNTAVATVDATGIVTGGTAGATTISYGNGCAPDATATITVIAAPGVISGAATVCFGATTALSNTALGGTWSSSNSTVATVDPATGIVSGVTPGTADINYTTGCGTDATATITVVGAPGAISGATSVCSGLTTSLSNTVSGGTWSSGSSAVASVSAAGFVTGGGAGSAVINYSTGCGTDATFTVTTIVAPAAITGASSVCMGLTTSLSNAISGGVWSSGNTVIATVDAAGLVTAGTAGVATIRYTTGCGTDATKTVTVISAPAAIGGAPSVCVGASTTLSESISGGTWTSTNTSVATVSATGVAFGAAAGTSTINYTTGCGSDVSHTITVIAAPSAISGAASVCSGFTTPLSNTVSGGTWSSSITTVATVNATTGLVTAGLAGATTISYSTGCGVDPIHVLTVIAAPTAIGGAATVCSGLTAQLSEAVAGGTWTSGVSTVATVSATGLVTGGLAGNSVITYSTGCGSAVTHTITTIAAPAAIGGAATVCVGATLQLSQAVSMGTWSSGNSAVATVNTTGLVTGVLAGPVTITYATGCGTNATKAITVIAAPAAITGASSACAGVNIPLSNTVAGGTWSSSNLAVATVSGAGLVFSVASGATTIRYTTGCGTDATKTITVVGVPAAITGAASVCAGGVTNLANTAAGGTWSSSNSAIATVDAFGNVWGAVQGTSVIRYATGCGADATKTITVLVAPGGIAGLPSVCIGSTLPLSNVTPGGVWGSSNSAVATINAAGLVTSAAPGTTTITYSTGCGSDQSKVITVVPNPGTISGPSAVCAAGGVITLSNTVAGGGWSSSNAPVASVNTTGNVTGGVSGTTVISYSTGCGTDATRTITVTPVPGVTLGTTSVCPGSVTALTNGAAGGVWSSDNTSVATVSAAGSVSAIVPGTALIIYSTGCGTDASVLFTVNSAPATPAPVLGAAVLCAGSTATLTSVTPGGVWSSDNTAIATVSASGVVTTMAAGSVNISYTVTNMCGSASSGTGLTVESPLTAIPAISGPASLCEGAFASLSNTMSGGVWSSSNTAVATVNGTGLVGGVAAGNTTIAYTLGNTCNTASVTALIMIDPLPAPAPIIGSTAPFCEGTTIALSDATPGGVWSSNLTTIATVSASGVVTGLAGGSSTIFYSLTNGCGTVASLLIITVDPMPVLSPVTGNLVICAGTTTQLSDTATTGAWSSGNTTVAIVNSTGMVTGLFAGVAPISYTAVNSCGVIASVATVTVTTTPILGPISGPSAVCVGSSINLANATPGGTWSTDVISVANVNNLGVVVGLIEGTDTIRYRVSNGCGTSEVATEIVVLPASACDPVKAGQVVAAAAELKVFPNPSTGAFTWNLHAAANEQAVIEITDVVGKLVTRSASVTNKDNDTVLDVPGGVYFISVKTAGGTYNAKITITR